MENNAAEPLNEKMAPPKYDSIYPGVPEKKLPIVDGDDHKNGTDSKSSSTDPDSLALVLKAVDFAARRHRKQRRKDLLQTPYINHPLGVAFILSNEAKITDHSTIIAAVLHDLVEDTKTTLDEISSMFGEQVAELVRECSIDKNQKRDTRMKQMLDSAPKLSKNAKLIELADKLYNLRDIERSTPIGWSSQHKKEYVAFCRDLLDALRGTNSELEMALDDVINRNIKQK